MRSPSLFPHERMIAKRGKKKKGGEEKGGGGDARCIISSPQQREGGKPGVRHFLALWLSDKKLPKEGGKKKKGRSENHSVDACFAFQGGKKPTRPNCAASHYLSPRPKAKRGKKKGDKPMSRRESATFLMPERGLRRRSNGVWGGKGGEEGKNGPGIIGFTIFTKNHPGEKRLP